MINPPFCPYHDMYVICMVMYPFSIHISLKIIRLILKTMNDCPKRQTHREKKAQLCVTITSNHLHLIKQIPPKVNLPLNSLRKGRSEWSGASLKRCRKRPYFYIKTMGHQRRLGCYSVYELIAPRIISQSLWVKVWLSGRLSSWECIFSVIGSCRDEYSL